MMGGTGNKFETESEIYLLIVSYQHIQLDKFGRRTAIDIIRTKQLIETK